MLVEESARFDHEILQRPGVFALVFDNYIGTRPKGAPLSSAVQVKQPSRSRSPSAIDSLG
jgi:hypothetical protein